MNTWGDETIVIETKDVDFFIRCFKHKIVGKFDNLDLIEIEEREFRKDDFLFYSQITKYRILGYLLDNSEHSLNKYFLCTSCFQQVDNYTKCSSCKMDFTKKNKKPFFLNCNYFTQYKLYNKYKDKYELGVFEEHLRDQRTKMCNPMKEEILMKALHPSKIQRILDITKDDWENLENYI